MRQEAMMQSGGIRHKILIVDDTLSNIEILHKILQDDYEIYFSKSGPDGLRIAKRELPDLILLDIMMPEMDGYEVCRRLKADAATEPIPVIFITAMGSDEDETKGLEYGAIDYITKPITPSIVRARVKNHLELKRTRDLLEKLTLELSETNRALETLAREDGLTGLANRRYFDLILSAELNRAMRTNQPLSLMMCDIDFFKKYNDHYGHLAGDGCLQSVGELMRASFRRAGELPARYGGEEFAVILPETSPEKAVQLAERLRQELHAKGLEHRAGGIDGVVTLSIGVAGGEVTRERNLEWLIDQADKALYLSKERGRNCVTVVELEVDEVGAAI